MLSLVTLSSVPLSSTNALAKAPHLKPSKALEVLPFQPLAALAGEHVSHKLTVAQAATSFPLTGSSEEIEVGREQYMQTNITISNTGRMNLSH